MLENAMLAPVQQPTRADVVTTRIREAIISGQLRPGQYLAEADLAAQLGVSRSPVREALHRLERERLVLSKANQRSYVWTPAPTDVDEIFSLRVAIEALAAEWSIATFTDEDFAYLGASIEALRQALDDQDYLRVTLEDKRFHEYLCTCARHDRLIEWWHQIMGQWQILIYRRNQYFPPYVTRVVLEDHSRIVAAMRARDLDKVIAVHREINARVGAEVKLALAAVSP